MGLGIREAIRLVQQEGSQARGKVEVEGEPGELSLEEASLEEEVEGEEEMGQDEGEESTETAQKSG